MSGQLNVTDEWEAICEYLPEDYQELADEHKQVQTQWGNAKIRTADDLLRLILLHVGADLPLRETVAVMAEAGGPDVSHVRLHKKMVRARPYLHALVRGMVGTVNAAPELWAGYDVITVDATAVCGPGATTTDARIHVQMRAQDLEITNAHVTDIKGGETFKRFPWEEGQLAVGDRGYCQPPGIGHVVRRGADVLVRVSRTALPVTDPEGKKIDVLAWKRGLRGHAPAERKVIVHDREADELIAGRLIAVRLPPAQAEQAYARLRREKKGNVTKADREAASYVVLFTTVYKSRLDATRCLALYRLRWQIELLFKRWKSICGLDRLPNQRDDTIHSWLYAKVLLTLLLQRMAGAVLFPPEESTFDDLGRGGAVDAATVEADSDPMACRRGSALPARAA